MIYNKGKDLVGSTGSCLCFSFQQLTNKGLNDFSQSVRRVHMQPPAGAQSYAGGGKEIKRGKKITQIIKTNSLKLDILLASRYEIWKDQNFTFPTFLQLWSIFVDKSCSNRWWRGSKGAYCAASLNLTKSCGKSLRYSKEPWCCAQTHYQAFFNYESQNNSVMLLTLWNLRVQRTCNYPNGIQALRV